MAEEDLIFGKNRHFFGGIEPSNMVAFSGDFMEDADNVISITATLPSDTVIDGQTLCTVAGAVIRRKITNYPTDEFDGDLVATITSSTTFSDTSVEANGTYYYSAFPFTTQGVYNRNTANRFVVNEPQPMEKFDAKSHWNSSSDTVTIEIEATLPAGAAGAVIRKSTVSYPVDENDGELFRNIISSNTYTDEAVELGMTYYYSAFPYTSTGAYNRSESNRASATARKRDYLFGYDIALNTADPEDRVTYPSDVDNYGFTPVKMNFGSSFNYGGWNFAPGEKFMPRPCMLNSNGTVAYYLNPDDYTKKSGGEASDVTNTSFDGNAMIEWPKIFTKRWEADGIYHFRCSDAPEDDSWECWSNYDRNNNQIEHFYTSIYYGSLVDGRLRSISGKQNSVNTNANSEINYAKNNGNDWFTEVVADWFLVQDLLVMMGKSTDCQKVYGYGRSHARSSLSTGTMNTKGLFWGSSDETSGVKVFGMENLWGNAWRRVAGLLFNNGTYKVKLTRGTRDGTESNDYNTTGEGYKDIYVGAIDGNSGGYISAMKTESFGRFPTVLHGSSTTYETDAFRYNTDRVCYACVGGSHQADFLCGPFFASFANIASSSDIGSSISCKPSSS